MSEPRAADSVAARLRNLRGSLRLSQEQLARRLGVSFATVNRWESGRTQISAEAAARSPRWKPSSQQPAAGTARGDTLPVAQASFVGRERELAELARADLAVPAGHAHRSRRRREERLAAEVLRRSFADADVVFVPLEQIRYPRTLASALASRLQVARPAGHAADRVAAGRARPRLRSCCCWTELSGSPTRSPSWPASCSQRHPDLRIVVTSRVVLGVPGEVCWTVPPLDCPSVAAGASDIAGSDAVQLFMARASERLPDFRAADVAPHAIAELCRRLDGLPLAIELIAGWVGTLSIREILQQRAVLLDSEPARRGQHGGRRLADVLQVSYDLLTPEQQRRLAMLSVFAGAFRIDDVQAILDVDAADGRRHRAAAGRLLLARRHPRRRAERVQHARDHRARFSRQRQLGKRPATGPAAASGARHALHFAALAAGSERALAGPDAADWAARLEAAVPDLDAGHALGGRARRDRPRAGYQRRAVALVAGQRPAGGRPELAGQVPRAGRFTRGRASRPRLCSAAVLAAENGDYPARPSGRRRLAMAIFEPLGLTMRMALAATVLGSANRYLGNHAGARRGFERAMELRARAWRPARRLGRDQQHGPARAGRRRPAPGAGTVRAGAGHQARARRAAVDRHRPGQPGRRADQDQSVGRGRPGADEGAGMAAGQPAADRHHPLQPGRAGRAPAGLGAGGRALPGGHRRVAGRRPPARRRSRR